MDLYAYETMLKELESKCQNVAKIINPDGLKEELDRLDSISSRSDFWNDKDYASKILKQKSKISGSLSKYSAAMRSLQDSIGLLSMAKCENDCDALELLMLESKELSQLVRSIEIEFMLNKDNDSSNAILTIQPGAGGTESQDWGSMLYRMYLRYAQRKGYKTELLDYQDGDEAGIKGVAVLIKGENAYGYLRGENGVHRLVRNSPFDSNNKRHTSFASVQVSPELDDDTHIIIDEKDIRVDTYRSSGAGGQHVNKTESAIRITHFPTGIVVQCQNDRSQHKNKSTAMKMLTSKLYALEKQKQNTNENEKTLMGWGHQIRSYVLSPYQQVKDLRSDFVASNTDLVLDGDIDSIIESVLVWQHSAEQR